MKSFTVQVVSDAPSTISRQYSQLSYNIFTGASQYRRSMGGCSSGNILPVIVPKRHREKIYVLLLKFNRSRLNFTIWSGDSKLPLRIILKLWTLIQERNKHSEICIPLKMSWRTEKVEIRLEKERSGLAFLSTDPGHNFGSNVGIEFGVMLRRKGPHKPKFAHDIVSIHSLMRYTDLIEYKIVCDTKAPLLRCFLFFSMLKAGDIKTTGR